MHRMLTEAVGDLGAPVEQPAYYRWTLWSESWLPFLARVAELIESGHAELRDSRLVLPDLY